MIARLIVAVLGSILLLYAAVGVAVVLVAIVVGAWRTYVEPLCRRLAAPPVPAVDVARSLRLDDLADLMTQPSYRLSDADLRELFDAPTFVPVREWGKR